MAQESFRPSKQFIIRGSIAIAVVVIILIVQTAWFKNIFHKKEKKVVINPQTTLGDVMTQDSNNNGIADWEEKLWGLDPTVLYTNGVPNKQIIEDKRKALGVSEIDTQNLNETDKLARELFAITAALNQSSNLDDNSLSQIASNLGSSFAIDKVTNKYSAKDLVTVKTTSASLKTYYTAMTKLVSGYQANNADLDVVINALENGDFSQVDQLSDSVTLYNKFAQQAKAIPVPLGVASYHLSIINSFAGIAQSFVYLQQLDDNPTLSLVGLAVYKGYASKLQKALSDMEDYLSKYDIISS